MNNKKNFINILLVFGLTVFGLWFSLRGNFKEVLDTIKQISPLWLIIILGMGIIYYCCNGVIVYILARKYRPDYKKREALTNAYIGAFFNGITPAGGTQVAQMYMFKKQGIKASDAGSILYTDFIIFQSTLLVYVGILMLIKFKSYLECNQQFSLIVFIGFLINASVIVILWILYKFPSLYEKASVKILHLLAKIHIVKDEEKTGIRWAQQIDNFTKEIRVLKKNKKLLVKLVGINIFRFSLYYSLPYIVALGLNVQIDPTLLFDIICLSAFVHMSNACSPLPGDAGFTEGAFVIMFSPLFGRSIAASIMVFWRFATYQLMIIIGGITFLIFKDKEVYRAIKEVKEVKEKQ
ncbi:MAG: lysylphosphatidylglycerol synthase transmembrane domain-containing protein [Erysipelotrichaceae bacterium]